MQCALDAESLTRLKVSGTWEGALVMGLGFRV